MADEVAGWAAKQPPGRPPLREGECATSDTRRSRVSGATWTPNPAKLAGRNRQPAPRTVRAFTRAELDAIAAELQPPAGCTPRLPAFAAATGLRPGGMGWSWSAKTWTAKPGFSTVRRTVSSGEVVETRARPHEAVGKSRSRPGRSMPSTHSQHAWIRLCCSGPATGRVLRTEQLLCGRVGSRHRGERRSAPCPHLRPAVNVRVQCHRRPDLACSNWRKSWGQAWR